MLRLLTAAGSVRANRSGLCPEYSAGNFGRCAKLLCRTVQATGAAVPGVVMVIAARALAAGTVVTFQGVLEDGPAPDVVDRRTITNSVTVTVTP